MRALAHEARATAALALLIASSDASSIANRPAAFVSVKSAPFNATGNGVTDDSGAIQSAMNTLAGTGIAVWIPTGTYIVASTITVPSGTIVWGGPDSILKSTMPFTGMQTNCIFRATATISKQGTATGPLTVGSYSISYTQVSGPAPVAGDVILISHGVSAEVFTVDSVAGVGPFVLTTSEPVALPFLGGDNISVLSSRPTGINILGNGLRFTGTGDRAIEFVTAYQCLVDNVHLDSSGGFMGDLAFSFDIGGVDCHFMNSTADGFGAGPTWYGFIIEAGEGCTIQSCNVTRTPGAGCILVDCNACGTIACRSTAPAGGAAGGHFGVGSGSALGSIDCYVIGCTASGGNFGFNMQAALRTHIDDCSFNDCSVNGIILNSASISDTQFSNISAVRCGIAFQLIAGVKGTVIRTADFSTPTTAAIVAPDELSVEGLTVKAIATTINVISATGPIFRLGDFFLQSFGGTTPNFVNCQAGKAHIHDGVIEMDGNGSIGLFFPAGNGEAVIDNIQTVGAGAGCTAVDVTAYTVRLGSGNDFSATTNGVVLHAGGFSNRFLQVLAGAATTVVAWPKLRVVDNIELQIQVKAGTLEAPYQITPNPGVGFTITPLGGTPALDTSTLAVYIS